MPSNRRLRYATAISRVPQPHWVSAPRRSIANARAGRHLSRADSEAPAHDVEFVTFRAGDADQLRQYRIDGGDIEIVSRHLQQPRLLAGFRQAKTLRGTFERMGMPRQIAPGRLTAASEQGLQALNRLVQELLGEAQEDVIADIGDQLRDDVL